MTTDARVGRSRGWYALRIAVVLVVSGSLAGFTVSFTGTQWYTAEATLTAVQAADAAAGPVAPDLLYQAWNRTLAPEFLVPLINRTLSYRLIMVSPEEIIQQIRENTVIADAPAKAGAGVTIQYSGDDEETTLDIVQMLVAGLGENAAAIRHVQSTAYATRIAAPPRVYSSGGRRAVCTLEGTGIGVLAALVAALGIGLTRTGSAT